MVEVGMSPDSVATADFNRDGYLDLAVGNLGGAPGAGSVSVLLGKGTGAFEAQLVYTAAGAEALAVGDFDEDGYPDLAVADGENTVSVLLSTCAP
jgi:hypothetical protein